MMEMAVPGRRKRGRPRRRWMDWMREDFERVGAKEERNSIGSNEKYFRAVATPNREKPKEEELAVSIVSKFNFLVHAETRANKTLLRTAKSLGEI